MDGLLFPPLRSQGCDAYQDARRRKLKNAGSSRRWARSLLQVRRAAAHRLAPSSCNPLAGVEDIGFVPGNEERARRVPHFQDFHFHFRQPSERSSATARSVRALWRNLISSPKSNSPEEYLCNGCV